MSKFTMNDSKSMIYKIVCKDLSIKDVFVYSTLNLLSKITAHKHWDRNPEHQKIEDRLMYSTVAANGSFSNWDIIWIENYPCSNPHELRARVRHWVEQLNANLNRIIQDKNTPAPQPKLPLLTITEDEKHGSCLCGSKAKDFKQKWHVTSIQHQNYLKTLNAGPVLPSNGKTDINDAVDNSSHGSEANLLQNVSSVP